MQALNLRLNQFRNFDTLETEFCPGTNLFLGQNGQGKTNLLEAIYFLGYAKSFRTAAPRECIRHQNRECTVNATIEHGLINRDLGVRISLAENKQLFLHRKLVGLGEFIGKFHALAFTQEHLKVVRGGPAERRAFLDRALVNVCPTHMQHLAGYGRALQQRNHLLSSALARGRKVDGTLLSSWDEKLIEEGSHVVLHRLTYVDDMKQETVNAFSDSEILELAYSSTIPLEDRDVGRIRDGLRTKLSAVRSMDERKGFTTTGPHRDDLTLLLNGKSLSNFGSAGQQRSCLLSLYFAQMEIHYKTCGFYPVFLMDDVEAELDERRLKAFLEYLSHRSQTFLTTAKEHALPPLGSDACRFRVEMGRISRL